MKYIRYLLATTFSILSIVAGINYFVDPAGVYHSDKSGSAAYVDALIHSKNGLWWTNDALSDWEVKTALSKYSGDVECVVIGSSRVMQIGQARPTPTLTDQCTSILNLGVAGAGIEAHFKFVYLALQNTLPKKVVLGIDAWTFAIGEDNRRYEYAHDYQAAKELILGQLQREEGTDIRSTGSRLRNLLSLKYTLQSLHVLKSSLMGESNLDKAISAPPLDERQGGEKGVLFSDGSLLYPKSSFKSAKVNIIPLGGTPQDYTSVWNDPYAINLYISLLRWIRSKGVEPILLMAPLHPNVWMAPESRNVRDLMVTEPIVRKIGSDLGLKVIGTFNPTSAGCLSSEFLDYGHPTTDCLAKLKASLANTTDRNKRLKP